MYQYLRMQLLDHGIWVVLNNTIKYNFFPKLVLPIYIQQYMEIPFDAHSHQQLCYVRNLKFCHYMWYKIILNVFRPHFFWTVTRLRTFFVTGHLYFFFCSCLLTMLLIIFLIFIYIKVLYIFYYIFFVYYICCKYLLQVYGLPFYFSVFR